MSDLNNFTSEIFYKHITHIYKHIHIRIILETQINVGRKESSSECFIFVCLLIPLRFPSTTEFFFDNGRKVGT